MSLKFEGKVNFLSGHYQDIIISENKEGNYRVKATLNEKYPIKELDQLCSYPKYDGLSDLEKLDKIVDSYLYNNTILMLSTYGRLKFYSENYQAVNAYNTIIDGYKSITRAMYLKLRDEQLSLLTNKIFKKYEEDRIRHLDKILKCQKIKVSLSGNSTCYIFNPDEVYIELFSNQDDNFNLKPLKSELEFLKILLIEFIKKNGYHIQYGHDYQNILHDSSYHNIIEFDDCLMKYVLQVESEVYHMNQEQYHNITIEEYISSLNQQHALTKIKKI